MLWKKEINQSAKAKQEIEKSKELEQVQLSISEILLENKIITKELLDNKFNATTIVADYVIGGPTLELICASYNLINNTDTYSYESKNKPVIKD